MTVNTAISEVDFTPGEGSKNTYTYSPISKKVGRLLGERKPKDDKNHSSLSDSWSAMMESCDRIEKGKNVGIISPWIYGIKPFGSPSRSEKRNKLIVTHIDGVNCFDELTKDFSVFEKSSLSVRKDFIQQIVNELEMIGIYPVDFSLHNIMMSQCTWEKFLHHVLNGTHVKLSSNDCVWVNFDSDDWKFKDSCQISLF